MTGLRARQAFPAETPAVARARQFTRVTLASWGLDDVADTVVLLVSEVVTNAVLHGRVGDIELCLATSRAGLRVEVHDGSAALPVRKRYGDTAGTGRGLVLVDALASRWGSIAEPDGKVVWFEVRTGPGDELRRGAGPQFEHNPAGAQGGGDSGSPFPPQPLGDRDEPEITPLALSGAGRP